MIWDNSTSKAMVVECDIVTGGCSFCTTTPTTISVTFASVALCACIYKTAFRWNVNLNNTWSLTNSVSSPCVWTASNAAVYYDLYYGANCTVGPYDTGSRGIVVRCEKTAANNVNIYARIIGFPPGHYYYLFEASYNPTSLCMEVTDVANTRTSCPSALSNGASIAEDGTVTIAEI